MLDNIISTKFKYTSENKMKLLFAILENTELRKWIYHLTNSPWEEPKVSIDDILKRNICTSKFSEEILTESKVLLLLDPVDGGFNPNLMSVENWAITIALPNEFWFMEQHGMERTFEIAHLIAETIDDQRLAGIGKVLITSYRTYNINQRWTALTLFTEVVNHNYPDHQ